MKVLIIFHGKLPGGAYPVAGIALRAFTNGQGLVENGVEVVYASRRRDLEGFDSARMPAVNPFEGRAELQALVRSVAPDLILAEGPDELASLRDCDVPIAVDLFAPRVLEAQWEELDASKEILTLLDALARADYFVVTTSRQRHFYLGLLPLAGVDCREDRIATVPLSVPPGEVARAPSPEPLLVSGGVVWPWQDPSWALRKIAARMEETERGSLHLLRGPYPLAGEGKDIPPLPLRASPRVRVRGLMNYPDMLDFYATAWCAVDLMAPNPERDLALSFRQLDALRCGVPLLVGAHVPLAEDIREADAGWVVAHGDENALETALEQILSEPAAVREKSAKAVKLATERFSAPLTVQSLLDRVRTPSRRKGCETLAAMMARRSTEAAAMEEEQASMRRELEDLRADILKKDAEIQSLNLNASDLLGTVGRLSTSLESALQIEQSSSGLLELAREQGQADIAAQRRSMAAIKREAAKKQRELTEVLLVRDNLEADVAQLQKEGRAARRRAEEAMLESAQLRGRVDTLEEELASRSLELKTRSLDVDKKRREIEELWEVRDGLRAENERLKGELERLEERSNALDLNRAELESSLVQLRKELEAFRKEALEKGEQLASLEPQLSQLRNTLNEKEIEAQLLASPTGMYRSARALVDRKLHGRRRKQ